MWFLLVSQYIITSSVHSKKIERPLLCPVRVCEQFCRMSSKVQRNPDAESQFYSLPFGQVVASMYWPKSLLSSPKTFLMSSIDYRSSVI